MFLCNRLTKLKILVLSSKYIRGQVGPGREEGENLGKGKPRNKGEMGEGEKLNGN